jgi:transcriptional regulator with XRE-family HTH domain
MYKIFEKLLISNNKTAYQISKETGITQASLSDWKNGRSTLKPDKLQKIADYFNVSVDYLLGRENKEDKNRLDSLIQEYPVESIKEISHICKKERINRDITEKYVSSNTEIPLDDFLEFENNYMNIGIDAIIKILSFLKININYVIGYITGMLTNKNISDDKSSDIINKLFNDEAFKNQLLSIRKMDVDTLNKINDNLVETDDLEYLKNLLIKIASSKNI